MSKRHILRPTFKAALLYLLLLVIFLLTILPVFIFFISFTIWRSIKNWSLWNLWWNHKNQTGKPNDFYTVDFNKVKQDELQKIQERRNNYQLEDVNESNLWGLSISGGGIRSATLGLGLMQQFISENILKRFDYMSTVSGGGYIGSCLSSILSIEERSKSDFNKWKKLNEEKKNLEILLLDENLPQEEQDQIYHRLEKLKKSIAQLDREIMEKQSSENLHQLDVTPENSPFTTNKACAYQPFDEATFNPKHQMHHLRTHGQYLTPDQGIGNRDVKRAFGAIWTGILHNLFAYFTVIVIVVSLAFIFLFGLSDGTFFETVNYNPVEIIDGESNLSYVMREVNNWYENGIYRQLKFIKEAAESHQLLCFAFSFLGLIISAGFLYFAFWFRRAPATDHLANNVTSGSTYRNESELRWLNFFRVLSYVIIFSFPIITVGLIIQFSPTHDFQDFYWIIFALPFFFAIGMILGTFMIVPLMEYSKFVWVPLLRNVTDLFKLGQKGKKIIYRINRRRNSPSYRSLYSAVQGQAMYLLILGGLIPFILLSVFSLRLEGNFIISLISLGVVYYFFTSKFGSGNDFFNRLLERVKLPLLNLSVFLMVFITMSVFGGWLINWHGSISQSTEIKILNSSSEGLTYDSEPLLNNLVFRPNPESIAFHLTDFDTNRYSIKIFGHDATEFQIDTLFQPDNKKFFMAVSPQPIDSLEQDYLVYFNEIQTDTVLIRITVESTTNILGYPILNGKIPDISLGKFRVSTRALVLFFVSILFLFLMGHLTNVNRLSLHYFYRDRLAQTYLMTEGRVLRSKSLGQQGMPLKVLRNHSDLNLHGINDTRKGPYHLIMAGLNLHGSNDLVRKVMKSEPFLFSSEYVGSASTGYVETEKYRGGTTTLSSAMTISGAAVSTGMGKLSFTAQAFFMTLFNLRTGFWIENPWYYRDDWAIEEVENKAWKIWKRPWWIKYLFYEMFGMTNAQRPYVNVSDGGFTGDNLGLLPLIKRQCKKIVICDFEEDKNFSFEAFTHACRIANIEHNTTIEINLEKLLPKTEENEPFAKSETSVIEGIVHYPEGIKGEILYIKSSIACFRTDRNDLDDMPVNVFNYKKIHPDFPHESTADQFFNDVQFEAYRALGNHLASQAVKKIKTWEYEKLEGFSI